MKHCELWTRAYVASKMGKWATAEKLWKNVRTFYEKHPNRPGSAECMTECDKHIFRARRFNVKQAQNEKKNCKTLNKKRCKPPSCPEITDDTVDMIMNSYNDVANAHDIIQRQISPPPLAESFYVVQSNKNSVQSRNLELEQKLQELKQLNDKTFTKLKNAMENLSPKSAFLFPDKLISRYTLLQQQIKKNV